MIRGVLFALALMAASGSVFAEVDAAALLHAETRDDRIVVLGELHGTHEAPALAGGLVRLRVEAGRPVTLALEVHQTEQARIDAFLDSAGDAAARVALLSGLYWAVPHEHSDGRRSVAMLALLQTAQRLRADGADLRVLAFDPGSSGGDADARNPRIAEALRAAFSRGADRDFVVLIGNYHARLAPPTFVTGLMPGQTPPVPTMAHLADVPMRRINITPARGDYWACMDGACQAWPVGGRGGVALGDEGARDIDARPRFVETLDDTAGYDARLWLPAFSAAPPVVRD